MKLVQPGEDFQAFLGIDPSVKVEYLPVRTIVSNTGIFSKYAMMCKV
jgi:hypothetical protein